ncbi:MULTISPECIES: hypothetical protein [Acidiplasma]|jgi:hypothetical protein|uniref:Uncharacterized protein n=2 Tax=Acidiplasma TaxID=507753 RepID=A0A0Q0VXQ6_9ARCH|nr:MULTISPECIES: hypothetical protein [Acidiplasma]KJE49148.1 hypothetical protein TZ01_03390 [Acidiplasma sp. MBA-1]KPV46946.1 hypothetical protein SE19_03295 [Acidiplasma aeolicum]KQB34909.1 hypothetical protein AOG54_03450 [Acidiplasma aeolicum]KQB36504.1 hypothetical protein AOG55_03820 [Acidiplasma cupricumulans]WMT54916.1 MAG: hypothetical protein RE470_08375 [Acidiplasma sp.]
MAVTPRKGVFIPRRAVYVRKRKHSSRERFEPGYITKEKQKLKNEKDNIINLRKALNKCGGRNDCIRKVVRRSRICYHDVIESEEKIDRIYLRNGAYFHLENNKWFYHKKE